MLHHIAHRGNIQNENKIEGVLDVLQRFPKIDIVEIDVRYSTNRDIVLCHDREHRNSKTNDSLIEFIKSTGNVCGMENVNIMVDIKAFGMTEAKKIARDVTDVLMNNAHTNQTFYLCSFNEYCVTELLSIREENNILTNKWKIGVISSGIPLGFFEHLDGIEFVSLDYSIICEDIMERLKRMKLEVYVWVVNDTLMQKMMNSYGVDGIMYDIK